MNLESLINHELWDAISHSYKSKNYTNAIRDAMSVITDVLRDKTGLDSDGKALVGQALSFGPGKPPRLQVNKLQTETEKSIQTGLQDILRGLYAFIRNPRSHERIADTKEDADSIILFIDYLLQSFGSMQQSFTVQYFYEFVRDKYFVDDEEYVSNLVDRIPLRKRQDTLIYIWGKKGWHYSANQKLVIAKILEQESEKEKMDFLKIISEELMGVKNSSDVTLILNLISTNLWLRLERVPRLRAENILLRSVRDCYIDPISGEPSENSATWVPQISQDFLRLDSLIDVIMSKLENKDFDHQNFVMKYFFPKIHLLIDKENKQKQLVNLVSSSVEEGNVFVKNCLLQGLKIEILANIKKMYLKRLENLTDPNSPEVEIDNQPFLGKFKPNPNPIVKSHDSVKDDIPF